MKTILCSLVAVQLLLLTACSAQKTTTSSNDNQKKQGPPSIEKLLEMDTNKDGKLSKTEVKGPLSDQFSEIDTDKDGFLSKTELENAPKPPRGGQGGPPPRRS